MSEQNMSLEQRVAALEKYYQSQLEFTKAVTISVLALGDLMVTAKQEAMSLLELQIDQLKMINQIAPGTDDAFKAEILTVLRRGESAMDQKEAALANMRATFEALKKRFGADNPPGS